MPHRTTLIPGDGARPEITEPSVHVLEATGVQFTWDVRQAGIGGAPELRGSIGMAAGAASLGTLTIPRKR
jgi:hypothetical protein